VVARLPRSVRSWVQTPVFKKKQTSDVQIWLTTKGCKFLSSTPGVYFWEGPAIWISPGDRCSPGEQSDLGDLIPQVPQEHVILWITTDLLGSVVTLDHFWTAWLSHHSGSLLCGQPLAFSRRCRSLLMNSHTKPWRQDWPSCDLSQPQFCELGGWAVIFWVSSGWHHRPNSNACTYNVQCLYSARSKQMLQVFLDGHSLDLEWTDRTECHHS
jgi:hypothetical protein